MRFLYISNADVIACAESTCPAANLPCNAHTFRRTFASNLYRKGVDVEHIMRLGGWETLDMVVRYTRSVKFEDSLKVYEGAMHGAGSLLT